MIVKILSIFGYFLLCFFSAFLIAYILDLSIKFYKKIKNKKIKDEHKQIQTNNTKKIKKVWNDTLQCWEIE